MNINITVCLLYAMISETTNELQIKKKKCLIHNNNNTRPTKMQKNKLIRGQRRVGTASKLYNIKT